MVGEGQIRDLEGRQKEIEREIQHNQEAIDRLTSEANAKRIAGRDTSGEEDRTRSLRERNEALRNEAASKGEQIRELVRAEERERAMAKAEA